MEITLPKTGSGGPDAVYEEMAADIGACSPEPIERLREALAERRDRIRDHARWGCLCEAAGEAGLAPTEYQFALRDDPENVAVLARLSTLDEERGDLDHAADAIPGLA